MKLKGRQPLMLMPTSVPSVTPLPTGLHDKQVSNVTVIYCRYVFDFVFRICSELPMPKVMMLIRIISNSTLDTALWVTNKQ